MAFKYLIGFINTMILVRVVISWVPQLIQSHVGQWIVALTEPVLSPIRRMLARIPSLSRLPIDFSPIAAWIILWILDWLIVLLYNLFH